MEHKTAAWVVETFSGFFEKERHTRISGHSLLPENDPSLLFINSGMAPLKDYFLGRRKPPAPDLYDVQRCVRTNDIADVGDRHHLTFFEMLGSWSIGNYWKEKAITLAWSLLTQGFNFPEESLYVSVYAGDPQRGIPPDDESARAWRSLGLGDDRIVFLGADNFWGPSGEYGPCGPCTEVFFDTGSAFGEKYVRGGRFDDVNRYIEIWNAGVFMEYSTLPTGMSPLETRSVDTGAGLERMTMALNDFSSVYETDLLRPLVEFTADQLKSKEIFTPESKRIADHVRAVVMLLADGAMPSNAGQGYVPRRLIRKAIAAARQAGAHTFDFTRLIDVAISLAGSWNAHVPEKRDEILAAFMRENDEFVETLDSGLKKLEDVFEKRKNIDGETAFNLFSTYGLPFDTIQDFFSARGGNVDAEGFDDAFKKHQETSRDGQSRPEIADNSAKLAVFPQTIFLGYDQTRDEAHVLGLFDENGVARDAVGVERFRFVTDKTCLYAEGGGQVSDHGRVETSGFSGAVLDVQKSNGVYVHFCQGERGELRCDDRVALSVDTRRRTLIAANHTATHLLQRALRETLGTSVTQAGSSVDPHRLRFDFTYPGKISPEDLETIENIVNKAIRANLPRVTRIMTLDAAVEAGALAFFAEKYDHEVRTVSFGDVSMELCGGTHAAATGDVALFIIESESSVSRGVRRIQAITGEHAYQTLREKSRAFERIARRFNVKPEKLEEHVDSVLASLNQKTAEKKKPVAIDDFLKNAEECDGFHFIVAVPDVFPEQLRQAALDAAQRLNGLAILAARSETDMRITVAVTPVLAERKNAREILLRLLPLIEGRGGGKATLAEGVGKKIISASAFRDAARNVIATCS